MMHHTFADGTHDNFLRALSQVTAAQTQLSPQNAASEIDRMIRTAYLKPGKSLTGRGLAYWTSTPYGRPNTSETKPV
jgi:hypothetical protein